MTTSMDAACGRRPFLEKSWIFLEMFNKKLAIILSMWYIWKLRDRLSFLRRKGDVSYGKSGKNS